MRAIKHTTICCSAAVIMLVSVCTLVEVKAAPEAPAGVIEIGTIAKMYGPVSFDHPLHDGYASCVECHHHLTGEAPSNPTCIACHRIGVVADKLSCGSCHAIERFSTPYLEQQNLTQRYHIDTPGLKGAYHLNCIRCHETVGTGPLACLDCHARVAD